MLKTLFILPPAFWVTMLLLVVGALWAIKQIKNGVGLPMLAVLGTVAVWYAGDVLYNNYAGDYATNFDSATLDGAWWEVALFVGVFLVVMPLMHKLINRRHLRRGSQVSLMLQRGANHPTFQLHLNQLFWGCVSVWAVLSVVGAARLGINESLYYFFPFLGHKADPWGRGRIGGGIDALLSLAAYVQMFVAAIFGVVAALARERRVRFLALAACLIAWPWYVIGRTRNTMLAVLMPAILAWVFLRLRGGVWQKLIALGAFFLLINAWFGFVIANRSNMDIAAAVEQKGFSLEQDEDVHHEGLNMYEELCWINKLTADGSYSQKPGHEYLAEIANPIPRTLWPEKPLIGIDYAVARGLAWDRGDAGVAATLSTGMIGQGVINFGRFAGPAFAALLMALWAAMLARLDLEGQRVGRIPLYALGLILTFNLGRDITLITLYTFIFGSAIVWWLERSYRGFERKTKGRRRRVADEDRLAEAAEPAGLDNQAPQTTGRRPGFHWWKNSDVKTEAALASKPSDPQDSTVELKSGKPEFKF